jgi:ADP-L-glycero-D-manno-heptose 6-epimerase
MKVIVTGGLGFIGSNIIKELNKRGVFDVYIFDTTSETNSNLNGTKFSDIITDVNKLSSINDVDVVFHQGAITDTTVSDESLMMKVNYDLSLSLYELSQRNCSRLIYASSAAVYGLGENGFIENASCENPLNVYGLSKLKFDNFIRGSHNSTQVVGLRYFNVFGPGEDHKTKMASPLNQFYHQAKNTNEIKVFEGSENFKRDFIFINDVINVNMFFYDNPEKSGIFNCGTGLTASFQDAARITSYILNVPIKTIPFPEILKGKYQAYTCADLTSLRNVGYQKEFTSFKNAAVNYLKALSQ